MTDEELAAIRKRNRAVPDLEWVLEHTITSTTAESIMRQQEGDIRALLAEIERLRAEYAALARATVSTHQSVSQST